MKKIFLLILIIILSLPLFNGCAPTTPPTSTPSEGEEEEPTGDRVVLVELFNTEGCAASKVINPIMEELAQEYGTDQVILVEEAGWGKYSTTETAERFDWYVPGTKHTPFIAFNGLSDTFSEGVVGGGGGGYTPPPPINHAPEFVDFNPPNSADIGTLYEYQVNATDPDDDELKFSLLECPFGMNIDENSGMITWNPDSASIGNNVVKVMVSDGELNDITSFVIEVSGSLGGIIVTDVGGPALEGSTVDIKDGATIVDTTTTNSKGRFGIAELTDGTYDIIVTQLGRATSKAQDVHIADGQTTIVSLVQKKVNVPSWECESPTITITGISEGEIISGTVANIIVNVGDDSDIKYLYIGTNYIPNQLKNDFAYYDTSNVTLPSFDTTLLPDGDYQIIVVAYDMNYNRTQYSINVIVENNNTGTVPEKPQFFPMAVTLGEKINYFSIERRNKFENRRIEIDPNIIQLAEGRQIDLDAVINAAENDSNLFIEIYCEPTSFGDNIVGYKVYRKFEGETNYQYIGSTQTNLASESAYYLDTDPRLAVGRKTYYKIKALNAYGESEFSDEMWTTPLAKFNLNLISPLDGAVDISIQPTLEWQPLQEIGAKRYYKISLRGKNDSSNLWEYGLWNNTSIEYSGPTLQYLKIYEWNIYEAYAYNFEYDYTAVSIASDGNGSLNGSFGFTTKSEQ